jgi:hypothetical protein
MIATYHIISQLREDYDIKLSAIIFVQKGILLPQVVTPRDIIQAFHKFQSILPPELSLTFPPKAAYEHVLMKIVDTDVFLGYALTTPLVNNVYNLYKLVPFSTLVKDNEDTFMFIGSDSVYLLTNTLKQMYVKLGERDLSKCKVISLDWHMCELVFPLKLHIYIRNVTLDCCNLQFLQIVTGKQLHLQK